MKRRGKLRILVPACVLVAGISAAFGQTAFKIPFDFQAGGKKLAKGDYTLTLKADGQVLLRQDATGKEVLVPVLKKLDPSKPQAEPQLVFDEVGDFAPSYTEYLTVYILSEVWLPGQAGLEIHVTKGAHNQKVVKAPAAK